MGTFPGVMTIVDGGSNRFTVTLGRPISARSWSCLTPTGCPVNFLKHKKNMTLIWHRRGHCLGVDWGEGIAEATRHDQNDDCHLEARHQPVLHDLEFVAETSEF
jgi:hypothetical protein